MTADQLKRIVPNLDAERAEAVMAVLGPAMEEFDITTPLRQAMFIAQVAHESGGFTRTSESFNYRPQAILNTFNTSRIQRFTVKQAGELGRVEGKHAADQEAIANIAYANRNGNGNVESGDGWRHRGLGWMQTTGKSNQLAVARHFGVAPDEIGDWLQTDEGAARSAAYFWNENDLNALADAEDFEAVSAVVNTGNRNTPAAAVNGYAQRLEYFDRGRNILGV